jgi:hypothetical protein
LNVYGDEYNGGCLGPYPIDPATVEWDKSGNSYSAIFNIPGRPPVDIHIGFENEPGEPVGPPTKCYVVLASNCMNYRRQGLLSQGPMEDTRLFQRLYDSQYPDAYSGLDRRTTCKELDIEFEVDLGRCREYAYGYYGDEYESCIARVRIRPAEFIQRQQRFVGEWDSYQLCFYRRVCITYEKDGERIDQYACYDEHYGVWSTEFPDIDGYPLQVAVTNESTASVTMLSMMTNRLGVDYPRLVQADCPEMLARWELEYGGTITIRGDRTADCVDCRCYPKHLCVELFNDGSEPIYRGTVSSDEYYGGYSGTLNDESLAGADPIDVSLSLVCDECTGQTSMEWGHNGEAHRVAVECPLPNGAFSVVEENESTTVLSFQPKGCADCFSATYIQCSDCPNGVPRTVYATFVPLNHPEVQTCLDGMVVQLFWVPAGRGAGGYWAGSFRRGPCEGCPEPCEGVLMMNCPAIENGALTVRLNGGGGAPDLVSNPGASCDPLYAEFGPYPNMPAGGSMCADCTPWDANEPDPTYKIILTA